MTHGPGACVLCGSETAETRIQLVEWIEPVGGERWSHVPRCLDRPACRERVERVLGEPWPLADRTPPPEPLPAVAPAEPDVVELEAPSWLR